MEDVFTKTLGGCLSTGECLSLDMSNLQSPVDMSNLQSSPTFSHPLLQVVVLSLELCHKRCGKPKSKCTTQPQAERSSQVLPCNTSF